MQTLSPVARAYVSFVVLAAGVALVPLAWMRVNWTALVVLAGLFALSEAVVRFRVGAGVHVSFGFPIAMAGIILLPPSGVGLVGALGGALGGLTRSSGSNSNWIKSMFNAAQYSLAAACCGEVYRLTGGDAHLRGGFPWLLVPLVLAALAFCLTNGLLLAGVFVTAEGVPFTTVWRAILSASIFSYLGYGLFGLMMAVLWQSRLGAFAAVLVLLPLFVARWTFAQYAEQQAAYDATVSTLVQAVETKDYYTRGHSERVAKASVMIARRLRMREDRVTSLRYAGILHDVGKLGVPTRLLQKSGPLTEDEFEAIQRHPGRGVEMIREIGFLDEARAGIMHHHERLDGRGYPMGLSGDQIPEFARIIAVADAFDCMTSTRSYRQARPVEAALEELKRCSGAQFDPAMVDALVVAVGEDGWEPVETPAPTTTGEGVAVFRYDHDDPTAIVPVGPSRGS